MTTSDGADNLAEGPVNDRNEAAEAAATLGGGRTSHPATRPSGSHERVMQTDRLSMVHLPKLSRHI